MPVVKYLIYLQTPLIVTQDYIPTSQARNNYLIYLQTQLVFI